jgi:hypothetical protein
MIFEGYWRIMFRQISVWGSTRRRNYMATVAGGRRQEELDPRAKNAIRGAFLGFFGRRAGGGETGGRAAETSPRTASGAERTAGGS